MGKTANGEILKHPYIHFQLSNLKNQTVTILEKSNTAKVLCMERNNWTVIIRILYGDLSRQLKKLIMTFI